VVEGPNEADGIDWYRITTKDGAEGWFPGSIMHTLSIAA
jgi:hypothetical protein